MSGLRAQLEQHLGLTLRPSTRLELGDLVAWGGVHRASPWATCVVQEGCLQVRYHDPVLIRLGCLGQRDRAGLAARLAEALGARPGSKIEEDFRPLWLALESLDWRSNSSRRKQLEARLDAIYEREGLAGASQAAAGYSRLAQWALLAGALESARA